MSYIEDVESLIIDNINFDWLKTKNLNFVSNKNYDGELGIIKKEVFETTDIYDKIDGELVIVKTEKNQLPDFTYNFSDFCWLDIDDIDFINHPDFSRPKKLIDAYWICSDIKEILDEMLPKNNISQSYNLIQAVLRIVEDTFDHISKSISDNEMSETVILLKIMFNQSIQYNYRQLFELDKLAVLSNDSLNFKINKSELTGLIAILIEAEILDLPKTGGKYVFFEKYFRWRDSSGKAQSLNNLKGDIAKIKSQISTDRRTKGAVDIFGKLEDGFNCL